MRLGGLIPLPIRFLVLRFKCSHDCLGSKSWADVTDELERAAPGLILKLFVNLLLMLIKFMNELEGMVSMSQVDFGVITKFFLFQVNTNTHAIVHWHLVTDWRVEVHKWRPLLQLLRVSDIFQCSIPFPA